MSVSALILTHNHEKYISQALDSALAQQLADAYEIVIADDCSSDGTQAIVQVYADRFPGRVRPLIRKANLGYARNLIDALDACQGDYVAYLDGDDYWTSVRKLHIQVEFLAQHPECSMCCSGTFEIYEDDDRAPVLWVPDGALEVYQLEQLLLDNFVYSNTVLMRKRALRQLPQWMSEFDCGADVALWAHLGRLGAIGFLREALAVYRIHNGGMWSAKDARGKAEEEITIYERLNAALGFRYDQVLRRAISRFRCQLACEATKIPPDGMVAVVTGGDEELLKIGRPSVYFAVPRQPHGIRAALHALAKTEVRYLLVPRSNAMSLAERAAVLREAAALFPLVWQDQDTLIFDCSDRGAPTKRGAGTRD